MEALHVVRCRQFTEHDPKLGYPVPTRLCHFNKALFDFEKECEFYITCSIFTTISLLLLFWR